MSAVLNRFMLLLLIRIKIRANTNHFFFTSGLNLELRYNWPPPGLALFLLGIPGAMIEGPFNGIIDIA